VIEIICCKKKKEHGNKTGDIPFFSKEMVFKLAITYEDDKTEAGQNQEIIQENSIRFHIMDRKWQLSAVANEIGYCGQCSNTENNGQMSNLVKFGINQYSKS
jgi:hypothetical protein